MRNSTNISVLIALCILLESFSIGKNSPNETFLYCELDIRDKSSYPITMRAITENLNWDTINFNNTASFLSSFYSQGHFVPNFLIYDKVLVRMSKVNNDSLLVRYLGQGQRLMNNLYSNSRLIDFKLCDGKSVSMRVTQITGKFSICKKENIVLPTVSDEIPITEIKEIVDIYIPIEIFNYRKPPKKKCRNCLYKPVGGINQ